MHPAKKRLPPSARGASASSSLSMRKTEYRIGRFALEPFRQLLDCGKPVPVKPKALAILSVLAEANGALVTKDDLMTAVWPNVTVEENAIQAHIAALRKIFGHEADLLCTVHGFGYRLTSCQENPAPAAEPDAISVPLSATPRRPALSL